MSRIHAITMPKWGIEMQEGTITGWHFAVGQHVPKGAGLLDVETEKIVNAVESPFEGTLRRILADSGDTQPVGALIGVFAPAEVGEAEIDAFVANFKPADTSFEPDAAAATETPAATEPAAAPVVRSRVSPVARRVAQRLGIDAELLAGTGRYGRVSRADVEAEAARRGLAAPRPAPAAAPAPARPAAAATPATGRTGNEPAREKMTSMRLTIARRLSESKQGIPHYRLGADLDVGALFARRAALKAAGQVVSVNDLLVRAVALALVRHPQVNAQLAGDEVLKFPHADVAVAVATDSGLVTPIVRAADTKDVATIAAEIADLAARAKAGKLVKDEITGGTFTVSNLGMYGVDRFDAIINPPQVAILAVGAAQERVVARQGAPAVSRVMSVQLSADHRVVDGAAGAQFLATLRELVESADRL